MVPRRRRLQGFWLAVIWGWIALPPAHAQEAAWTLANGFEVQHLRRPSLKVLASIVTVSVGSRNEDAETSGLSHLLEHMLFDGTTRRSRAEINEGSKRYGGYVNATTRTSHTTYISVFPAEYAELSLDLQADMLFHSTIPGQELEKERKVVIEEMTRDRDSGGNLASEFHRQTLYTGTSYARPVLGHPETINSVSREKVLDYYRRHYAPHRMKALIISPFTEEQVRGWVDKTYGAAPRSERPPQPEISWTFPTAAFPAYRQAAVPAAYLHVSLPAPSPEDPAFHAYDLLTRYLAGEEGSPLQRALRGGATPLAQNLSAGLDTEPGFSVWTLTLVAQPERLEQALESLRRALQAAVAGISEQELARLQRQVRADEAMLVEQPHYYGLFKAPFLHARGFSFVRDYPERIRAVTTTDIQQVAARFFAQPRMLATALVPKGRLPAVSSDATAAHGWRKEQLPNGMTLIAQGHDESDVFALCVLTRQRSALEPAGREGLSDLVHRLLLKGTESRDARRIQETMDRLAVRTQMVDNLFIPFDDHYTSTRFTFLRLEVLDELRGEALDLVADVLKHSVFPEPEVERVTQEMRRLRAREADNRARTAQQRLRGILLSPTHYTRPVLGSDRSLAGVTRDDLLAHYSRLYAPSNLVLVAAGRGTTDSVLRDLRLRLESPAAPQSAPALPGPQVRSSFHQEHLPADKQQTQIAAGVLVGGWASGDAAALRILNAVLSERLAVHIRETLGLAYSVAADLQQEEDYGWIEVRLGTRAESARLAEQELLAVVRRLAAGEVSAEERERAVNGLWGSTLRTRLSRIGQVFYRGLDEVRGPGFDAEDRLMASLQAVTLQDLSRVAAQALDPDRWVMVSVGRPQ